MRVMDLVPMSMDAMLQRIRSTGCDQALYSSQTPRNWTGKPTAVRRAIQAGIERVPIRSVGLQRLQENPKSI